MTEITYHDNAELVDRWCRWLLDDLQCQLRDATEDGLVADGAAMGVAHVLHGLKMAHYLGEFQPGTLAAWLRKLAASLESNEAPPILAWAVVGQGHRDGERTH